MEWSQVIMVLLPAGILALMGYLIRFRRMYWLMSGYNTMSKEKKKNVDVEHLGPFMGNMLFVLAGILLVGMLLLVTGQAALGGIVLALMLPAIIYLLIAAQKYDGNTRQANGTMRPGAKILIGFIVVSIIGLVGFVGFLVFRSAQPGVLAVTDGTLNISGMYGQQIPVSEMQKVELIDTLPRIERRTNGSAVGSRLRGHFTMEGIGAVMLYLDKSQPPFIHIEAGTRKVYLNAATPEATRQLYGEIIAAQKK